MLCNQCSPQMKWLIHRKHARAFFSFRLSPAQADLLCGILNMYAHSVLSSFVQKNHVPVRLVDDLNSNDNGDWQKNAQSRLDECDIKLLATFAPSSQQDMQVQRVPRVFEFRSLFGVDAHTN
jgi:hypothetical protein